MRPDRPGCGWWTVVRVDVGSLVSQEVVVYRPGEFADLNN
jgi:hypothetical protein